MTKTINYPWASIEESFPCHSEEHAILTDTKNSFIMVVLEKKILNFSQNLLSKARLKIFFLIDNHYKTIFVSVRIACSSHTVFKPICPKNFNFGTHVPVPYRCLRNKAVPLWLVVPYEVTIIIFCDILWPEVAYHKKASLRELKVCNAINRPGGAAIFNNAQKNNKEL